MRMRACPAMHRIVQYGALPCLLPSCTRPVTRAPLCPAGHLAVPGARVCVTWLALMKWRSAHFAAKALLSNDSAGQKLCAVSTGLRAWPSQTPRCILAINWAWVRIAMVVLFQRWARLAAVHWCHDNGTGPRLRPDAASIRASSKSTPHTQLTVDLARV